MTKKYAKVDGHSNLIRDLETNAIINTDKFGSEQYSALKSKKALERQNLENLQIQIDDLKLNLNEIKSLLRNLTNESR